MSATSAAGVRLVASAIGAAIAEAVTLPADMAKVRLQVQSSVKGEEARYHGIVDCVVKVAKVEGVAALWKGIVPALIRQVSYHSFTFVLYEPIRDLVSFGLGYQDGTTNYFQRLICAGLSAAIAISIFNPTEVVKTQMQSAAGSLSMKEVVLKVHSKDGIKGFWAGLKPNVARTFLVNGAEIGTYDETKLFLVAVVGDGLGAHLGASFIAGLTSACVSTPADVVKTRFMNAAGSDQAFRGPLQAAVSILRNEGAGALYKGFLLIVVRKLLWCMVFFVLYERLLGLLKQVVLDLDAV
eukprot:TRINITY_DN2508_c4_g1_i1.p1 TRINITY_DN2508_c4_g1~~TRINITY_DN2508_c4_g1_i1.p1  ORF type:complete len:323 (+),score=73.11 TRINITY_DN2508_c4_g1_i1:84-971(+)